MKPGKYSYLIILRDYAKNTKIFYNDSFKFKIPRPLIDYLLPIFIIIIIGITGISTFIFFKGLREYSRLLKNVKSHKK